MSSLSEDRVTPDEPPFTREGVDYFGPFKVKALWFYIYKSRQLFCAFGGSLFSGHVFLFVNALRRFIG